MKEKIKKFVSEHPVAMSMISAFAGAMIAMGIVAIVEVAMEEETNELEPSSDREEM